MGAPLEPWARLALLLLVLGVAGLAALATPAIGAIDPPRQGRHREQRGPRAPIPLTPYVTGVRMHAFAMTPGVVHLSTCQALRGRVAPPWPWADGKTYVEIKKAMKLAHNTACARCKPVSVRSR